MKVFCVYCKYCDELVYSRHHHDCRFCACEKVYIDGGQDGGYMRIGGNEPYTVNVDIKQSLNELKEDYLTASDKYGKIKLWEIGFNIKEVRKKIRRLI